MGVLVCLAEHAGQVIPKEKLVQTVWPDTFVSDDALTRAISELRRVFGDDAKDPQVIQTIAKRGYRLLAPVVPVNGITHQTRGNGSAAAALTGSMSSRRTIRLGIPTVLGVAVLVVATLGF